MREFDPFIDHNEIDLTLSIVGLMILSLTRITYLLCEGMWIIDLCNIIGQDLGKVNRVDLTLSNEIIGSI